MHPVIKLMETESLSDKKNIKATEEATEQTLRYILLKQLKSYCCANEASFKILTLTQK